MKNTFGKLGLGLAGAVACAGLLSAGVQTANAQIVLTNTSPVETLGGIVNSKQTYDFTYYMDVGAANQNETVGSGAYVQLTLDGADSDLASVPLLTVTNSHINAFTLAPSDNNTLGASYNWSYTGSNYTFSDLETFGYITVVSYTQNALTPSDNVPPGNFETKVGANTDYVSEDTAVPDSTGTPLAPLALPVAVWPGLLTLAGMVVVGGLRMRRRMA